MSPPAASASSPTKKSECVLDQLETYWREIEGAGGDLRSNGCSPFKDSSIGFQQELMLNEEDKRAGLGIMNKPLHIHQHDKMLMSSDKKPKRQSTFCIGI